MADVAAWVKQHKTATAGIAAGAVLVLILLRRGAGSSTSGSSAPLQIAQLQSQQNLAEAQIQAQQNEATIGAQTQVAETNAQLQAEQNQQATGLALSLNASGTNNAQLQEEIAYAEETQQTQDSLVQSNLPAILKLVNSGRPGAGINILSALENPSGYNPSSYNNYLAGTSQPFSFGIPGFNFGGGSGGSSSNNPLILEEELASLGL